MTDRELPEGVNRKQIRTIRPVREYIKGRAKEEGKTVSEYLESEVLPENWEDVQHGYTPEDIDDVVVRLKTTPDVNAIIESMNGERVTKGEILAFYALVDALRTGDGKRAEEIIEEVPEFLWTFMEGEQ